MTWLAPWMMAGAAAAAAIAVALHFIAWDFPQPAALPTARFVPDPRDVPAARRRKLVDLALLALRVLTILLIGAAFARPALTPTRSGSARVVLLDRSRAVANPAAAADSARAWSRDGATLVVFDSAARVAAQADTVKTTVRGSLSAALVAAVRVAMATRARPDSSEIVIVSPLLAEELDAATLPIRATWPGAVRVIRVAGPEAVAVQRARLEARGVGDDPVVAGARLVPIDGKARVVRGAVTAGDSAFATSGGTLIHWPLLAPGEGRVDAALTSRTSVVVAQFIRPAPNQVPPGQDVVLQWSDGAPAASEHPLGDGCVRTIRAGVPEGDAALRPRFLTLLAELAQPCARHAGPAPAQDSTILALERPARTSGDAARADLASGLPLAPWLFASALLTALVELLARRRR